MPKTSTGLTVALVEALRAGGVSLPSALGLVEPLEQLLGKEAERRAKLLLMKAAESTPEDPEDQPEDPVHLSPRELEVMHLLATRMSYKEIGSALGRSPETVKSHVGRAFRKLGINRAADIEVALRRVNPNSPARGTTGEPEKGAS